MAKKILYLLIGTVSILLGIFSMMDERLPVILCGIGLILYGIGGLFHWRERRKAGAAGGWALFGALVAVAFGAFILIGGQLGDAAGRFVLFSLSIWLMGEGVLEVLGAVMYRKAMTTADLGVQAPGSFAAMVMGVAMVAAGILGLIFPVIAAFIAHIWIVVGLILAGVRMLWMSRSSGALEEVDA